MESPGVREYPKAYIYPGFLEGHLHGMEVASRFDQVDLAAIDDNLETTMDDFVALMAQDVKEHGFLSPNQAFSKSTGPDARDSPENGMGNTYLSL